MRNGKIIDCPRCDEETLVFHPKSATYPSVWICSFCDYRDNPSSADVKEN